MISVSAINPPGGRNRFQSLGIDASSVIISILRSVHACRRATIRIGLIAVIAAAVPVHGSVGAAPSKGVSPAAAVRAILAQPDAKLDYARAAVTFDKLLDPSSTPATTEAMIERLVDAARQMAGPNPTDVYKLAAIRKAIYIAGPWNYGRAFAYDQADPLGTNTRNKLLSTYVETRLGNCVSMPILFLVVADRLGLDVRLATAPLHVFVRYRNSSGIESNLEATSGGHPATAGSYLEKFPMTDEAVASGAYMRTLSRRETVAQMANTIVDMMLEQRRWQEAVDVADQILAVNPRETYTMVKRGTAFGELLRTEFTERYPTPTHLPPQLQARYQTLVRENKEAFNNAEALGWRADNGQSLAQNSN